MSLIKGAALICQPWCPCGLVPHRVYCDSLMLVRSLWISGKIHYQKQRGCSICLKSMSKACIQLDQHFSFFECPNHGCWKMVLTCCLLACLRGVLLSPSVNTLKRNRKTTAWTCGLLQQQIDSERTPFCTDFLYIAELNANTSTGFLSVMMPKFAKDLSSCHGSFSEL